MRLLDPVTVNNVVWLLKDYRQNGATPARYSCSVSPDECAVCRVQPLEARRDLTRGFFAYALQIRI